MSLALLLSHGVAAVAGFLLGRTVVRRAVNRGVPMTKTRKRWRLDRQAMVGLLGVFAFLAAIVVIAIQSQAQQSEDAAQQVCLERWGREVTETARARSDAAAALEKAGYERDAALDKLMVGAIQLPQNLSRQEREQALNPQINKYVHAVSRFDAARKAAIQVRAHNQWPALRCP